MTGERKRQEGSGGCETVRLSTRENLRRVHNNPRQGRTCLVSVRELTTRPSSAVTKTG
jgi:hypothetical protein